MTSENKDDARNYSPDNTQINVDDIAAERTYVLDSLLEGNYRFENSESSWDIITQRINSTIITIATLVGVGYIIYYCLDTLQNGTSPEAQRWAQSTLTLIVGTGVGYLTGKQTKG